MTRSASVAYHHEFLGEPRGAVDWGSFGVVETSYAPAASCSTHAHFEPYVCVILAGRVENRSRCGTRRMGPGEAFFRPSGTPHAVAYGRANGARCLMVRLAPVYMQDVLYAHEQSFLVPRRTQQTLRARTVSARELSDLVDGWVAGLARTEGPHPSCCPAEEARRAIDAQPLEAPISIADVAERVGVHASHLARAFRRRWGRTMSEYVIELRVSRAARLLARDVSIADAAASVGFYDQSHMTRSFVRFVGTTPRGCIARWNRARFMQDV